MSEFVEQRPELDPVDVGWSLTGRSVFEHRMVALGRDRDGLIDKLTGAGVLSAARVPGRTAYVFAGQGAQRLGMGRELYRSFPAFAAAWDAVERCLEVPVRDVVWGDDTEVLTQTRHAQPALFAVEVALFRLLECWGLRPDIVIGHSVGEIAAAHIAGVLSLEDAARLVSARAGLMQSLPGGGCMVAVRARENEVRQLLDSRTAIAAVNGSDSVVVSGAADAVERIADALAAAGRRVKRLPVSHAFHSPAVEPMLDDFAAEIAGITAAAARIPLVSNVTGRIADDGYGAVEYWVQHVRHTVLFAQGIVAAATHGATRFVEIGPDSGLSAVIADSLELPLVVSTLGKNRFEPESVVEGVGRLFTAGVDVDWTRLFDGAGARRIELPPYAFQRSRYWIPGPSGAPRLTGTTSESRRQTTTPVRSAGTAQATPVAIRTAEKSLHHVQWHPVEPGRSQHRSHTNWAELKPDSVVPDLIVLPVESTADSTVQGIRNTTLRVLGVLQTWLAGERFKNTRLLVVTRGAIDVAGKDVTDLGAGPVWGLVRAAQAEHPGRILLADLDESADLTMLAATAEPELAVRDGQLLVPRLVRLSRGAADARTPDVTGTVLIVGGATGYGAHAAHLLASAHGARRFVLITDRQLDAADRALVDQLESAGAAVETACCDVSDREALRSTLSAVTAAGPLSGVVYAAPSPALAPIRAVRAEQVGAALRHRADGAWHLHELTAEMELSFFLLLSSVSGTVLPAAQACDAAANAFLNALASYRNGQGLPATSVAWGPWAESGVGALTDDLQLERLRRQGIRRLSHSEGLALLEAAIARPEPVIHSLWIDSATLAARTDFNSALLSEITRGADIGNTAGSAALATTLKGLSGSDRQATLLAAVHAMVATALGHPDLAALDPDRPFLELGVESLSVMDIQSSLRKVAGVDLAPMEILDAGSVTGLARLAENRMGQADISTDPADRIVPESDLGVAQLFRTAIENRATSAGLALIGAAADLRSTFEAGESPVVVPPLTLSRADAGPLIVCISAPILTGGVHQYTRIAKHMGATGSVVGIPLPGFAAEEALPATPAAAVDYLADVVEQTAGERPVLLLGYSSGGVLAHAVADHLDRQSAADVRGLVMLDSFKPDADGWGAPMEPLFAGMLADDGGFSGSRLAAKLTGMAMWGRHLRALPLDPPALPVLFVQCRVRYRAPGAIDLPEFPISTPWSADYAVRGVDFDHFSLLTDGAAEVAGVIADWIHRGIVQ
ncbi:acyltransferase domain-containing protein [Nocardia sp. NPDC048505]|uniref:acyltransferase domain-containing protein n=1 Tax=Nocardia sp. NPDC048505 TaxID=3155756 RepID=UPI00340FFC89